VSHGLPTPYTPPSLKAFARLHARTQHGHPRASLRIFRPPACADTCPHQLLGKFQHYVYEKSVINGDKGLFSAFPVYGCVLGDAINSDEVPMRFYWYVTQAFHRQAQNNWKMTIVPLLDNFLNFFFDLRKTGGGAQISLDAWLIMNAHPMKANAWTICP